MAEGAEAQVAARLVNPGQAAGAGNTLLAVVAEVLRSPEARAAPVPAARALAAPVSRERSVKVATAANPETVIIMPKVVAAVAAATMVAEVAAVREAVIAPAATSAMAAAVVVAAVPRMSRGPLRT